MGDAIVTATIKSVNVPFFTDGEVTLAIRLPVKVDATGEWLSAEQAELLEALHTRARFLISASTKVKRPKRFILDAGWIASFTYTDAGPRSDVVGLSHTSPRVGALI